MTQWRAITVATALLASALWAAPLAAVAMAPFVFLALAVLSRHPSVPGVVLRAMGLSLVVGAVVSVLLLDAVTGVVAGVGAGGLVALRNETGQWRARAVGVAVAAAYTFTLLALAGDGAILFAPIFPLTALGLADQWTARKVAHPASPA